MLTDAHTDIPCDPVNLRTSLHDVHEMNARRADHVSVCKIDNCWTDLDEIRHVMPLGVSLIS